MKPGSNHQERGPNPIAIDGLRVRYGRRTVLSGIDLHVQKGSVTALLGRNGSGKTSLVRCLLGQQKPEAGACRILGTDSWKDRTKALARVAVVPEEPDAPPEMNALELGRFSGRLCPGWDHGAFAARLRQFQLPSNTAFQKLSRGQKALLMLALALSSRPAVLILDDPSLGLDAVARQVLFEEVLGSLGEGGPTVFITTHDLDALETIADRVAVLTGGKLALSEEMENVKNRFRKLTYGLERPEDPADAGQELDGFDALSVKVRGWGVEAVVSNFTEERFSRLLALPHVVDAETHALSLRQVFIALAGEERKEDQQ